MFKMPKSKQEKNAMLIGGIITILGLAFIPPQYNPVTMIADVIKNLFNPKSKEGGDANRRK